MIIGQPLHKTHAEVKAAWIRQLATGDTSLLETMPASKSMCYVLPKLPAPLQNSCTWNLRKLTQAT
jgi:hypothetical protein